MSDKVSSICQQIFSDVAREVPLEFVQPTHEYQPVLPYIILFAI